MYLPPAVRELTAGRFSLVSRQELLALGVQPRTILRWLDAGWLVTTGHGHYRLAGAAEHELGRLSYAVQRAGEGARVGGEWACALHGLEGFELTGDRHIIVPPGRRVRGVDFLVVRTAVPPEDQAEVLGLPALTVERSLIDALPDAGEKKVRKGYDRACRTGQAKETVLRARAEALGRARGAPQMRVLLAGRAMRMESEGERALDALWLPGDPLPVPQVWVRWGTKRFRLDFAYCDARLALESDSKAFHGFHADFHRDRDRDLALAELDIQTLRITAMMLRTPAATRRRILAVYHSRLRLGLPPIIPDPPG